MPGTKSTTAAVLFSLVSTTAVAQPYLEDRGPGVFTSMFGTYIRDHELLVYPFYEYTLQNLEYKPAEMGYGLDEDFRGKFREHEAMLFVGYGVSDRLALEFESALYTKATLRKSPNDPSPTPSVIRESGLGDTQVQADWRWLRETASRPEVFSYLEVDLPLQRNRKVIGTHDWFYKLGTGAIKGFSFGTLQARAALEYDTGEGKVIFGEYALEYLKRVSDRWKVYGGIEGDQDEIEAIVEGQLRLTPHIVLKLNNAFGLTPKAPRLAPEIGLMFSF